MSPTPKHRALLALILLVPAPSIGVLAAMWLIPGPVGQGIYAFCKLWLITFPLVWWLWVDRGKISGSPLRRGGLGVGVLIGFAIAAAIVLAYTVFGARFIDAQTMRSVAAETGLDSKATYLGFAFYLTFVNSILEEYVWRWFVYRKSELLIGSRAAMVATALFFSVHHALALYPQFGWGVTLLGSGGTFVGSLVWSWCYRRYGSIWPAVLSHVVADLAVLGIGWKMLFA